MSGYEISAYRPELRGDLVRFLTKWWSSNPSRNDSHFEWKYVRNPYVPSPLVYVATQRGRIVGVRGFVGSRWLVGARGDAVVIPMAQDLYILPRHRDRGLLQALTDVALADLGDRGYALILSMTASEANFMYCWTTGWKFTERIDVMQWPEAFSGALDGPAVDRNVFVERVGTRVKRILRGSNSARRIWRSRLSADMKRMFDPNDSGITVAVEPRLSEMSHLATRLDSHRSIRHVRDVEYYRWRLNSSLVEHGYVYVDGPELEGFMVLTWTSPRSPIIISNWKSVGSDVTLQMFRVARQCKTGSLTTWTGTLPDDSKKAIHETGFRPASISRFRPCVLIKTIGPFSKDYSCLEEIDICDLSNWDVDSLVAMAG